MAEKETFSETYKKIDELSKFVKINRKALAESINNDLKIYEKKLHSISALKRVIDRCKRKYENLTNSYQELEKNCYILKEEHDDLVQKYRTTHADYLDIRVKYDFVSDILKADKIENEALARFEALINNDFLEFANEESSLAEEAQALLILQSVLRELRAICSFPSIYNKVIVSVGGGFSAGKSEFISSFFSDKTIKLPIGIKPATAIPTYIFNGDKPLIKGYSYKGGSVDILPELYAHLSHDFIKTFSFNLKDIVPMMAIETHILNYNHICFIDTPGYNPANTGTTESDFQTAREYLENANVLLWVVGIDASEGAILASDLEFLENLSLEDKKLYVIANKADLKSPDEIEEILDSFEETLDGYYIDYYGISAYSSVKREEIAYRKESMADFLESIDNPVSAKNHLIAELNKVFNMYQNAINEQINWTKNIQSNLKSLELDLMEEGMDIIEAKKAYERFEKIKAIFDIYKLEEQLIKLKNLKKKFIVETNNIFGSIHGEIL